MRPLSYKDPPSHVPGGIMSFPFKGLIFAKVENHKVQMQQNWWEPNSFRMTAWNINICSLILVTLTSRMDTVP